MAHGKALGQYQIKPVKVNGGFVWDVIAGSGQVVCWAFDNFWKAIQYTIMLNQQEKTNA